MQPTSERGNRSVAAFRLGSRTGHARRDGYILDRCLSWNHLEIKRKGSRSSACGGAFAGTFGGACGGAFGGANVSAFIGAFGNPSGRS
jgi:hypothetical protein